MAGAFRAIAFIGLLVQMSAVYGADLNACSNIADCLVYHESTNCLNGARQVCVTWVDNGNCVLESGMDVIGLICGQNMIGGASTGVDVGAGVEVCFSDIDGGQTFQVGIRDGSQDAMFGTSTNDITLTLSQKSGTCTTLTNVCSTGGTQDIALNFAVSACEAPSVCGGCTDYVFGECSNQCGSGSVTGTRTCTGNCPPSIYPRTITVPCSSSDGCPVSQPNRCRRVRRRCRRLPRRQRRACIRRSCRRNPECRFCRRRG